MSKDVATACGIGGCVVIALLAYLFHDTLGLTPKTAVTTAAYIVVLGSTAGALWFFSAQSHDGAWFGPGNLWPFLLALFVMCWFPALDEWSMTWGTSIPSIVAYSDTRFAQDPQWWATVWAKILWVMIPFAGGYVWKYLDAMR